MASLGIKIKKHTLLLSIFTVVIIFLASALSYGLKKSEITVNANAIVSDFYNLDGEIQLTIHKKDKLIQEKIQNKQIPPESLIHLEELIKEESSYEKNNILVFKKNNPRQPILVPTNIYSKEAEYNSTHATEAEQAQYELTLLALMQDDQYSLVQPNYVYEFTSWTEDGDKDTPSDFDTTPTAETGNHWYYEKSNLRNLWQDQDCNTAGTNCGGDSDIVIAVLDSGLAFETYTNSDSDSFSANDDMFGGSSINLFINGDETANDNDDDDLNGYNDDYNGAHAARKVFCDVNTCTSTQENDEGHPNDDVGHGTFVTNMIATVVDNDPETSGNQTISAGHNLSIMPVKIDLDGGQITSAYLVEGINYAIDNNADVINLSLSSLSFGSGGEAAVEAALSNAESNGIVIFASVSNSFGGDVGFPASSNSVIAVGAINSDGSRSSYSASDSQVDFVAYVGEGNGPGDSIYQRSYSCFFADNCNDSSTFTTFSNGTQPFSTFHGNYGTSFVAPQFSAMAGIMISENSGMTPLEIYTALKKSVTDLGVSGKDNNHGWGALDYELDAFAAANPLSLTITEPDGIGDNADFSYTIQWSAIGTNTTTNFYWDTDNFGFDGTLIAFEDCNDIEDRFSSNTTSCIFNTAPMPAGNYSIYGCIDDPTEQVCEYSSGTISVTHNPNRDSGRTGATTEWKTVNFNQSFTIPPVVFAQVDSENEGAKVYVDVKNVSTRGFDLRIEENTASGWDGIHPSESVSWYALETTNTDELLNYESVESDWKQVTFINFFSSQPKIFAMIQTENDSTTSYAEIKDVTNNGFKIRIEEAVGNDDIHIEEIISWIAFEDNPIAQEGTASTTDAWSNIVFPTPYSEPPTLISFITSENNAAQANVDIKNLTSTGFSFRIEEDSIAQNGTHISETISWSAFDYTSPDYQLNAFTANEDWNYYSFDEVLSNTPGVFAGLSSLSSPHIETIVTNTDVTIDIKQVNSSGFAARIEGETSNWSGTGKTNNFMFYAILKSNGTEYTGKKTIGTNWKTIYYGNTFSSVPYVFIEINSENEKDIVAVETRNVTTNLFQARLHEPGNTDHTTESITWLAFETPNNASIARFLGIGSYATF